MIRQPAATATDDGTDDRGGSDSAAQTALHTVLCAGRTELTCARTHTKSHQHTNGSYSHSDNNPKCMHMAHTLVIAAVTMAVAKCVTKCAPADLVCTSHAG